MAPDQQMPLKHMYTPSQMLFNHTFPHTHPSLMVRCPSDGLHSLTDVPSHPQMPLTPSDAPHTLRCPSHPQMPLTPSDAPTHPQMPLRCPHTPSDAPTHPQMPPHTLRCPPHPQMPPHTLTCEVLNPVRST